MSGWWLSSSAKEATLLRKFTPDKYDENLYQKYYNGKIIHKTKLSKYIYYTLEIK